MMTCLLAPPLASGGLLFAFEHSNPAGKLIIFILLIASIFSWAVMWTKWVLVRKARRENARFMQYFHRAKSPLAVYEKKLQFDPSPLAAVYYSGAKELCFHLLGSTTVDDTFAVRLSTASPLDISSINSVRSSMDRAVGEEMLKLESQLILLATAVSGSPFLGLLGTVWGVMDAFSGVALAGQASLAAMAPGVSGSLITTVIALCVAIPSMFGYNYLVNTLRGMTVQMENFAAECSADFEHQYGRRR
ncbi:MAG: MotA/TolQ/ExbB proton channel family protein [Verrucomicrobiota bacterium]